MNDTHLFSTHSNERSSGIHPRAVVGFVFMLLLALVLAACGPRRTMEAAAESKAGTTGAALFENLGCIGCHRMNGRGTGPSLVGLYGQLVPLANGETVTADDQYIRTSILNPSAHIRAGYSPDMPSFERHISEEELSMLVEYVSSLKGGK